jgi:electron transfer flavoprotein beta subunit
MKAKKKPIDELELDELGISDVAVKVEVVSLEEPPKRSSGVKVASIDELVEKLKNEARAL